MASLNDFNKFFGVKEPTPPQAGALDGVNTALDNFNKGLAQASSGLMGLSKLLGDFGKGFGKGSAAGGALTLAGGVIGGAAAINAGAGMLASSLTDRSAFNRAYAPTMLGRLGNAAFGGIEDLYQGITTGATRQQKLDAVTASRVNQSQFDEAGALSRGDKETAIRKRYEVLQASTNEDIFQKFGNTKDFDYQSDLAKRRLTTQMNQEIKGIQANYFGSIDAAQTNARGALADTDYERIQNAASFKERDLLRQAGAGQLDKNQAAQQIQALRAETAANLANSGRAISVGSANEVGTSNAVMSEDQRQAEVSRLGGDIVDILKRIEEVMAKGVNDGR
jgi:hypothetical protein